MNKNEHRDERFSDKMQNFSKVPPPELWERIREDLDEDRKSRIIPLFWRYAAGIIILLGIGTAVFISNYVRVTDELELVTENELNPTEKSTKDKETEIRSPRKNKKDSPAEPIHEFREKEIQAQREVSQSMDKEKKEVIAKYEIPAAETADDNDKNQRIITTPLKPDISSLPRQMEPFSEAEKELDRPDAKRIYTWEDLKKADSEEITEIENEPDKAKISIGAVMSPLYTYRDLGNISKGMNELFNESESGKISYTGGFNVGLQAGKRLSIHSGLLFSRLGVSVNDILTVTGLRESYWSDDAVYSNAASAYLVNNSTGSIQQGESSSQKFGYSSQNSERLSAQPNSGVNYLDAGGFYNPANNYVEEEGRIDQYFHYLEIPFMLKYVILEREVDIKVLGGISTNFLIGNNVYYIDDNQSQYLGHTSDIRTINYSGNVGIGIGYDIREQLNLLFEPQFKYHLNSVNNAALIGNRPYSFGLYTGIVYLF